MVSLGLTLSSLRLQEAWDSVLRFIKTLITSIGLGAREVQNSWRNVPQMLLPRHFREELQQRMWGKICPQKGPIGSCLVTRELE